MNTQETNEQITKEEVSQKNSQNNEVDTKDKDAYILILRPSEEKIDFTGLDYETKNKIKPEIFFQNRVNKEDKTYLEEIIFKFKKKAKKKENDAKIKELNEWKEKLIKIGQDMYNIQEMKDIDLLQKKKNENLEKLIKLKKQYEILENSRKSNIKKYDSIITRNEKDIFDLNDQKTKLMKELEKQLRINDKFGKKINEFYGIKENDDKSNNDNINRNNNNQQPGLPSLKMNTKFSFSPSKTNYVKGKPANNLNSINAKKVTNSRNAKIKANDNNKDINFNHNNKYNF